MVDLPHIRSTGSEQVVHSLPPVSSLSSADIKAPYAAFAHAMDQLGGAFSGFGRQAGRQAGRPANDGESGASAGYVDSGVPPAAQAASPGEAYGVLPAEDHSYTRLVQMSAMINSESAANNEMADFRQKFAGNPEAFMTAATEFKNTTIDQFDEAGTPAVGVGLDLAIDQMADAHLSGLLRDKHASDVSAGQQAVSGKLDELATSMHAAALSGGVDSDEFRNAQADYRAVLGEARDNPLFGFKGEALVRHLEATVTRTREAAFVGTSRRAFATAGPIGALEFARDNIAHLGLDESEDRRLRRRIVHDIDTQVFKTKAEQERLAQVAVAAREDRTDEGFAKLAGGALDQAWLDRHNDDIGHAAHASLQRAIYSAGGDTTMPAARSSLTALALASPSELPEVAADMLSAGRVTRADFAGMLDLAKQVKADQKARPWVNDLRSDLARWPDAVSEFGEFLAATPNAPRAQVREAATALAEQYGKAERRRTIAGLPLPRFVKAARHGIDGPALDEAHTRMIKAAKDGELSLADFAGEAGTLKAWREALGEEA